jgi:hypothetical protein
LEGKVFADLFIRFSIGVGTWIYYRASSFKTCLHVMATICAFHQQSNHERHPRPHLLSGNYAFGVNKATIWRETASGKT